MQAGSFKMTARLGHRCALHWLEVEQSSQVKQQGGIASSAITYGITKLKGAARCAVVVFRGVNWPKAAENFG